LRLWIALALICAVGSAGCFVSEDDLLAAYDRDGDGVQPPQNGGKDCDNNDASIHPGAPEVCGDGIDNNCDGVIDDDGEGAFDWFPDGDGDSFGVEDSLISACKRPSGHSDTAGDCDDLDPLINPTVTDVCDGVDNDCDGQEDEDRPPTEWFVDGDDDGFGAGDPIVACEAPSGTVAESGDCEDGDVAVRPGQTEVVADGVDQDCDGVDDCFEDADLDGFGSPTTVAGADLSCSDAGEADNDADCDDLDAMAFPGAPEVVADGVDQDCDAVDTCWADGDGDGFGNVNVEIPGIDLGCMGAGEAVNPDDCNDGFGNIYPGAPETPADGLDQDCDGVDHCYADLDLDGYGGISTVPGIDLTCTGPGEDLAIRDCNDADIQIYPGAVEVVADGRDQNCDGVDSCWSDADGDGQGTVLTVVVGIDLTCTGPGESTNANDCNDGSPAIYLGAPEVVADGVDQDCDNRDDCFVDGDFDSFGDVSTVVGQDLTCSFVGESGVDTDCNDGDGSVYPGAPEVVADGIDQDCDAADHCWLDNDGDGFGTPLSSVAGIDLTCMGSGESPNADDCNDGLASIFLGAPEVTADGVDQDCDLRDDCFVDGDLDGFGVAATTTGQDLTCSFAGESAVDTDCDDLQILIFPGAVETPGDGIDQDCDLADDCYEDLDEDTYGSVAVIQGLDLTCANLGESPTPDDCNDGDPFIHPAGIEAPADNIDQDCDDRELCYDDQDRDGLRRWRGARGRSRLPRRPGVVLRRGL